MSVFCRAAWACIRRIDERSQRGEGPAFSRRRCAKCRACSCPLAERRRGTGDTSLAWHGFPAGLMDTMVWRI